MDLPVYEIEQALLDSLGAYSRVLLKAPTGSGKSTAVPQMLLDSGAVSGLIVVVQPRRIAARMLARRVAAMRGSKLGGEVGYVVRFDRKMGSDTRIVFVTDGVLEGWLGTEAMDGVGAILFDEFHERRLASDLCLAMSLQLQESGSGELKVMVMSATIELEGIAEYLGEGCVSLEARGRSFPVEVGYQAGLVQGRGQARDVRVWERCVAAVKEAVQKQSEGHVLVFLPGVYEIRRCCESLEQVAWARGFEVCPLYSALSSELQDRAVYGGDQARRRIIVATNVAETSLTIDGVRVVVDAGLARVQKYDPVRGVDTLMVEKISRAAADQRAGRAGRTGPGMCVRLWSEADHGRRDAYELAEVQRADMSEAVLDLKRGGYRDVRDFPWFEQPSAALLDHAECLLEELGACESSGEITEMGYAMAQMRLHPRYARFLLAANEEGCVAEALFIAASVQGEGVFGQRSEARKSFCYEDDGSDFVGEWRAYCSAEAVGFDVRRCQNLGVLARGAREVAQSMRQLAQVCERGGIKVGKVDFEGNAGAVRRAMLAAFSDQVGIRLGKGNLACRLVGQRSGKLDEASVVREAEAFIVTELTEVGGKDVQVYLNRCVALTLDELKSAFPDAYVECAMAVYDETIRRVVQRVEWRFRDLVLHRKDGGTPDGAAAAQLLAERVASGDLKLKKWDVAVEQWIARLLCLREWMPELELPGFDEEDRAIAFEQICEGALGYKEIKDREVMPALESWLSAGQRAALDHYAPVRMKLSNGREVKLKYAYGKAPTIALQVQRLFGVKETPTIANGEVAVLVQVCAPNQRPWQMTQDLASFWESGFAQMKKDLAGRYPKHQWDLPEA
ncbi:ATP-dependent helicase HrpB [Rubritalea tangerina]|uniref:ATP-dependent helicase HrpB n=1 Tax=Rubritalea tangerina TaxID=430798 RepID=A0ABW4Z6E4_9BACT